MLRIICCHIEGQLRDETRDALMQHAAGRAWVEFHQLPADNPRAYGEHLAREWQASVRDAVESIDLAIVEPDIVIDASVVGDFLGCPCNYGGRPYSWGPEVGIALGCTRFRASFISRYPDAMQRAVDTHVSFRQLDVVLQRHILVREHNEQPHLCGPTVVHLNPLKQLREDANPTPLATLPAW